MFIRYLVTLLGPDTKFGNLEGEEILYLEQGIPIFLRLQKQKHFLLFVSLA